MVWDEKPQQIQALHQKQVDVGIVFSAIIELGLSAEWILQDGRRHNGSQIVMIREQLRINHLT
ncbi:MAG: hypothetical protein PUP90_30245 [Nostoc sp. S4]|nr:hypothetical protein [Nostoc sp. S4]